MDVPALVDLAERRTLYSQALLSTALERGVILAVPTSALGVARSHVGSEGRARLHLLRDLWAVVLAVLTLEAAEAAGDLLATGDTSDPTDVAAAHVTLVGLRRGWPVVSDRGATLRALAGAVTVEELP